MILRLLKSGYQKVASALQKTSSLLGGRIRSLFSGQALSDEQLDELEEILYEADLGVSTVTELVEAVRGFIKENKGASGDAVVDFLKADVARRLSDVLRPQEPSSAPLVYLIVGVNGNGKTTSVAKLAKRYSDEGHKVLMGAADTFRAAAVEQLTLWSERIGCDIVKGQSQADPAAVAYDTVSAAVARKADVALIDTAGRLHTKTDLMNELAKIRRSCGKVLEGSPHLTLLVLDATTGQNAVDQAKIFHQYTPIDGIVLTKLDGTAKGGIVLALQQTLNVPVLFIGVGEGMDDLQPFEPEAFAEALFA